MEALFKPKLVLSPQQQAAVAAIRRGKSVLLTGPAGTGKSTVLNLLRRLAGDALSVTASTGIAAMSVGGTTLHTFAGLGFCPVSSQSVAARILGTKGRALRNIRGCSILAIDEISLVSGELFSLIDFVFRIVRDNPRPFGGIQLVLFGDFLQLPPISKPGNPASFAFQSPSWEAAKIEVHTFTRVYRQLDQPFSDGLGRLRVADINHPSISMFAARNNIPLPADGIRPIIIHTHNAGVDEQNNIELAKLTSREFVFEAEDTGQPDAVERLNKDCLAQKTLRLRKDAQVILLANLNLEDGLANGSMGTIIGLSQDEIVVRFGKNRVEKIKPHTWTIQNNGATIAERAQYPLRLAYAISSHKVQGMSLDRIQCHLAGTFEYGQAYVAVSRVRTIDGLFLHRSTRAAFRAHPKAVAFYDGIAAAAAGDCRRCA